MKKLIKLALLTAAFAATSAHADNFAITNVKVHTLTEQGLLEQATVVVKDGKITAINPDSIDQLNVIDGSGKVLTPGFINSFNRLGLREVGAVAASRDDNDEKVDILFDPSIAFNPLSSVISYTRKGGITRNITDGGGGNDVFKGQAFSFGLNGDLDTVIETSVAVTVRLGARSNGSRAITMQQFADALKKAHEKASKAKDQDKDKKDDKAKELSDKDKLLAKLLSGEKPLVVFANRAPDLLFFLKLKEKYGIDLVLGGASDAVLIKDKIATSKTPVLLNAMSNLPSSFDSLHAALTNAGELEKAGVKIMLNISDLHNGYMLRFDAGNAVANGMSYEGALAAISKNVAEVFGLNGGTVAKDITADLVLWNGDPLDYQSSVIKMWIAGEEVSTTSRQDKLRDRYMATSDMPRGYIQ